jgi:hypothetical protein
MGNKADVKLWSKLQWDVLNGRGAELYREGAFDADDAGVAALGMGIALYLGDSQRACELAARALRTGHRDFARLNSITESAVVLAYAGMGEGPRPELADSLSAELFPGGKPASEAISGARHVYDALFETLRTGIRSPRLFPLLVRDEQGAEQFDERWRGAKSLYDRVVLATGFGRRRESALLAVELAESSDVTRVNYQLAQQIAALAARAGGEMSAASVIRRFFPTWAPGVNTESVPLAPALDPYLATCLSTEDRVSLLATPRGGLPPRAPHAA